MAVVALSLAGRKREKRLAAEKEARARLFRKKRMTFLELGLSMIGDAGMAALKKAGSPMPLGQDETEAVESGVLPGLEYLRLHIPVSAIDAGAHIGATKLSEIKCIDIEVEPRATFGQRLDASFSEAAADRASRRSSDGALLALE